MNTAELRAIAEAATPGEWKFHLRIGDCVIFADIDKTALAYPDPCRGKVAEANALHIATFHPARVKALLDCVSALERIGRIGGLDGAEDGQLVEYDGIWASVTARAALKALEAA